MKNTFKLLLILTLIAISTQNSYAVQESTPIAGDPRIHQLVYKNNEVYRYLGHYRYASIIEFEEGEKIASISLGDSTRWTTEVKGSRLFLKPVEQDAETNMTIITNSRIYFFELAADEAEDMRDENMTFITRFKYPETSSKSGFLRQYSSGSSMFSASSMGLESGADDDELPFGVPDIENEPDKYNFNYTITGSRQIAPLRIFDDGEFTYFQFRKKNAAIPAIFAVDDNGNEYLVNYRISGDYMVVEQVAKQYTLRNGDSVTCAFNEDAATQRS